jgi:hypothetical protein
MAALLGHAGGRHAPPDGQLLRYRNGRRITYRRYDHLWDRLGRYLPWVRAQQISMHWVADRAQDPLVRDPVPREPFQPALIQAGEKSRMSAPGTEFTFFWQIPAASASSASCGLRPGRNPQDKPGKSVS